MTKEITAPALGLTLVFLVVVPSGLLTGSAWQDEGHVMVNQVAAEHLPQEIPAFFREAVHRLAYLGPEPDRWRRDSEFTLKTSQEPDHFIKMELAGDIGSVRSRYEFYHLLYKRRADPEARGEVPADSLLPEHVGLLPYTAIELYDRLKVGFRQYRALVLAGGNTKLVEGNIITYAGWLGHYAADAANPHHTSFHYNGWLGSNPEGYAGPGIHGRFEGDFVRNAGIGSQDFTDRVGPPRRLEDPFADFLRLINESQSTIELLYELDKQGAFTDTGTGPGLEFTLERLAAGSQMLLDLWYTAWVASDDE